MAVLGVRRSGLLAAAAAGAALPAVTGWGVLPGPSARTAPRPPAAQRLPPSVPPAFVPGPPQRLSSGRHLAMWAPVRRRVTARRAPGGDAPAVTVLGTLTGDGSANVVSVLGRRRVRAGETWLRVGLPVLPNGTTGWVPRSALGGYGSVDTRLEVDLRRLRATLLRDGRPVFRAPVGIGMRRWPTPRGTFYIRSRLTRYRSPAYGPLAFGTNARSPTLTDWPGGGFVGIHGTDRPDLVPGRVSHGCIRLRNRDIVALGRLMRVGTPLTIR